MSIDFSVPSIPCACFHDAWEIDRFAAAQAGRCDNSSCRKSIFLAAAAASSIDNNKKKMTQFISEDVRIIITPLGTHQHQLHCYACSERCQEAATGMTFNKSDQFFRKTQNLCLPMMGRQ